MHTRRERSGDSPASLGAIAVLASQTPRRPPSNAGGRSHRPSKARPNSAFPSPNTVSICTLPHQTQSPDPHYRVRPPAFSVLPPCLPALASLYLSLLSSPRPPLLRLLRRTALVSCPWPRRFRSIRNSNPHRPNVLSTIVHPNVPGFVPRSTPIFLLLALLLILSPGSSTAPVAIPPSGSGLPVHLPPPHHRAPHEIPHTPSLHSACNPGPNANDPAPPGSQKSTGRHTNSEGRSPLHEEHTRVSTRTDPMPPAARPPRATAHWHIARQHNLPEFPNDSPASTRSPRPGPLLLNGRIGPPSFIFVPASLSTCCPVPDETARSTIEAWSPPRILRWAWSDLLVFLVAGRDTRGYRVGRPGDGRRCLRLISVERASAARSTRKFAHGWFKLWL
ncbi:hypothetical protein C8Q79DRAFT_422963 [Trametes meyenii]|nr:hypothetical protein C8Q79DRAFT_422963 [Trametes meyenii]